MLSHPVHWFAFGLPTGLAPFAPGTFGSLWGVALFWVCRDLSGPEQWAIAVVTFVIGIPLCGVSARKLGIHDHSGIVWDEIVGCYITLLFVAPTWPWMLLGFCLFRFFDIVKPRPIRDLDHRLKGGLGIMLDDIAAALYAVLTLLLIQWVQGRFF